MKKIPPGAEASNVLVGEVDFLEKPIIAFVRLSPAVLITGLTEVPVPTRYYHLEYKDVEGLFSITVATSGSNLEQTDSHL